MKGLKFSLIALCAIASSCNQAAEPPLRTSTSASQPSKGTVKRERDPSLPTILIGTVVSITDGDSLVVQVDRVMEVYKEEDGTPEQGNASFPEPVEPSQTFMIDLLGIDAPELDQPWGEKAKQALADKVQGKSVMVSVPDIEPAEQTAGWVGVFTSVNLEGISEDYQTENVNFIMVEMGHAWHDVPSAANNQALAETEQTAREAGRGLWSSANPISPWAWRKKNSETKSEKNP